MHVIVSPLTTIMTHPKQTGFAAPFTSTTATTTTTNTNTTPTTAASSQPSPM